MSDVKVAYLLRAAYAGEITTLRAEMDELRRTVGVYCMIYVRSILPPDSDSLWMQLEEALSTTPLCG